MANFDIINREASAVLVGSFNPAIFHPEWLVRHNLIPADDLEGAKVEIVHQDISKFFLDWLGVDVLRNKFIARTNDPSKFDPLRDLVISIFKILDHTPTQQLGMNLIIDYEISSSDNWHKIGDALAPKKIWSKSLPDRIGLKSLVVQSPRLDDLEGFIQVSIGPTEMEKYKVRINVNNHVELEPKEKDIKLNPSDIISDKWNKAMKLAEEIAERTIKEAISE